MNWFQRVFSRDRMRGDLSQEILQHLDEKIEFFTAAGMSREDAIHAARRAFGNATLIEQRSREVWMWPLLESLWADIKFSLRQLKKSPGFTLTVILTLALGIGATTAIFAFVDAALIQPLPYSHPSRLVDVTESIPLFPHANLSYPDYLDWKRLNKVFASFAAWTSDGYMLRNGDATKLTPGTRVSANFFSTLGVRPVLGRDFRSGEDLPSAQQTVILSYAAWQKYLGGKRDVIGHAVSLSGVPYTVIGVLPQSFQFALRGPSDFWVALRPITDCQKRRSCRELDGIARLKDGVSVQTALADAQSIAHQLEREYPDSNRGQGAFVAPLSDVIVGNIRMILLALLAGAGLLLAIAYVNIASLLLVRSESRRKEVAVREALGASSARLTRQFFVEGIVLVAAGLAVSLAFAWGAIHLLLHLIPAGTLVNTPYVNGLQMSFHVFMFAVAVALLATAVFAVTPVLRLPLKDIAAGLADGGRGSAGTLWRRLGSNLVPLELAIAAILLACAGLLGKSFYRLLQVHVGFQPQHLAVVQQIELPQAGYTKDAQLVAVGRRILARVSALPGVKSAAITTRLPVENNGNTTWFRIVGRPYNGVHNEVPERDVSPDYFSTLGAVLFQGRYFTDADAASKPNVVVVNQAFARTYFQGEDPIGKQLGDADLSPKSIETIVGVVGNIKEGALDSEVVPALYVPFDQSPDNYFALVVRASQSAVTVLPTVVSSIRRIAPTAGVAVETTMQQKIESSPTAYLHRSAAWLVGGFAALALILSLIGSYGVVAYSVSQRTRELGIRVALGASRGSVYRLILGEAGLLAGAGIAAGILCSIGAATLMKSLLFGVHCWDISTLTAVAAMLALTAMLAGYIPARRAASVDPMQALRAE